MTEESRIPPYFPHNIQISAHQWHSLGLAAPSRVVLERGLPTILFYRDLVHKLNRRRPQAVQAQTGHLVLYATLLKIWRHMIDVVAEQHAPQVLEDAVRRAGIEPNAPQLHGLMAQFVSLFPPGQVLSGQLTDRQWLEMTSDVQKRRIALRELLLIRLAAHNPALDSFREILDDRPLHSAAYPGVVADMEQALRKGPVLPELGCTLAEALWAPIKAAPSSLADQLGYIREHWQKILPTSLQEDVLIAFDILREEERERGWGGGEPGPPPVMEFGRGGAHGGMGVSDGSSIFGGYDYPEHEQFSPDADWMPNVVLMAKMVYVWLDQLSRQHGYPITRLDQVPDSALELLARQGFTGLWLIGVWERSPASQRIKQLCGNADAIASAYSLYDYEIAADLGGWEALASLRERALRRGIRLASDMVPNHTGIYSRWVIQHPDWFVQTDYPPFPTYQFTGEDLSHTGDAVIQVEDGYWTKTDAAVVFRMIERSSGRTRYIYHGNDGTSIPWNDTAQLNYLLPEVREAVIQTILHVARNFPIIRFDAAMTLAKKHFQRLWFPIRGLGGGIPSRAEHGMSREEFDAVFPVEFWREVVDRVAAEAPGTLLLAEAFWLMEGYFVRTLGMHRVYNSAFMNMLKKEENAKYRQTIRNVLEFNPEVLQRFVNFMNNPDEKTAVEQFGSQGKYFGACLLLATMPGLPMFGHGQIEGYREKYGMEYKRAYWDEQVDEGLVRGHEMWIFPILRQRGLFSGAENFALFDFYSGTAVDENVFAYSNRSGNQRALVLFHNRHARTAGWIRESVPIAVKGSGDTPHLQRTTLGDALDIAGDEDVFYGFRDHTRGLEYVRNGRELHEKGLYAELGEYEFHVFTDFRELRDDADAGWARLCAELNGQGVDSLADEWKQLRYGEINTAFRTALELVGPTQALLGEDGAPSAAIKDFWAVLHRAIPHGVKKTTRTANSAAKQSVTMLARVDTRLLALCGESMGHVFAAADSLRLGLAWLMLRDAAPDTMVQFGLDCTLRRLLSPEMADRGCALVAALCSLTPGLSLAQSFAAEPARRFMLVHDSGGVEWFNKERFEELAAWLALLSLIDGAAEISPARVTAAATQYRKQCDMAVHAGYRVHLYRDLLAELAGAGAAPARVKPRKAGVKVAIADKTGNSQPTKKKPGTGPAR